MKITFSSMLMAVFCSGILEGILYRMRKRFYFAKVGICCMVLVYLFCILRILLPIDFSFTQGISIRGIFSNIYEVFCLNQYSVGNYDFTIRDIFLDIWLLGSVILILRFVCEYLKINRILFAATKRLDVQCMLALDKVYETKRKVRKVTILTNEAIQIPVGIGIWNWKILLPDHNYTNQELYYILLHEYTHFSNGDLAVKVLTHIFCCIFWWNPLMYLLKNDLDKNLEIKCDLCITEELAVNETAEYLEAIVSTLKSSEDMRSFPSLHGMAALADNTENEIVERFQIILKNKKNKGKNGKGIIVWMVMICIIWAASYSFVPLPSYETPIEAIEDKPESIAVTPDNSYVVIEKGKYYWVVEGYRGDKITAELAEELKGYGFEIREER